MNVTETGLPIVQFEPQAGNIDLAWGHPDPALLPLEAVARAAQRALQLYGSRALTYGAPAGPGPFLEWVADRLETIDGQAPDPGSIVATAGNSQAFDQIISLLTEPGDVVLVENPTYHIALRILRDHPVELVPVGADEDGIDIDLLDTIIDDLKRGGRRARLLYTVPTYNNPTGASLAPERRHALVTRAANEGFRIVEDDAYRELSYDGPAPASLWSEAPGGVVLRLVSFSKSLAPGLRTGAIVADAATAHRFAGSGVLDSGGGISHFACLVVAECGRSGDYAAHVERLRTTYRARRDALVAAVRRALGPQGSCLQPAGGYFLWITLREASARALLPGAEALGTSFVPGESFFLNPGGTKNLRLSFARYDAATLTEAAARLGEALG